MKIRITESALSDLDSIQSYYKSQNVPEIGIKLVSGIILHIETLEIHPKIGRIVPEFNDVSIKEIIHKPFTIVYSIDDTVIYIIRVWRSERLLKLTDEDE